jgi:DNA-binding response OmpR family regulator
MAKIVIVEDDLAIAQMYRLKFEAEGHRVGIAGNGKLGLALCEEMKPDLVLLDLMMPEMNGDEMLEKMRQKDWGKEPKVIILTNVSEQEAPERLKDLHIDGYVVKAEMTPKEVAELAKSKIAA